MSHSPRQYLLVRLQQICKKHNWPWPDGVSVEEPPAHVQADYALNLAMQLAHSAKSSPRELAEQIICDLQEDQNIELAEVAGPGFINLKLTSAFLLDCLRRVQADERLGVPRISNKRVVIDYGGPNVAKPLHVGHLRASIIGESIKRILRFAGDTVFGDIHLGDWGTPMGMLLAHLREKRPDWSYFQPHFQEGNEESPVTIEDLKDLYPVAAARYKQEPDFALKALECTLALQSGDPGLTALWKHFVAVSLTAIKEVMENLGVDFDWWYGESHYHERIAPMIERLKKSGMAIESEGALILPLRDMPDEPPLMLKKSDGAYLYSTTDLAAVEERVQIDRLDALLYVVDQRQKLHFEQVFAAARQAGIAHESTLLEHLGFGTVNGPDGRPFKTRDGGVMQLSDLLALAHEKAAARLAENGTEYERSEQEAIVHAVAMAALKFADLSNHRISDYSFDTEKFTSFEGKTGPYLLYTSARISSIKRKLPEVTPKLHQLTDVDRKLTLRLLSFADEFSSAYSERAPHIICESLYQLAVVFSQFYHQTNIVAASGEQQQSWLALSCMTQNQLTRGLDLLGIPSVERF